MRRPFDDNLYRFDKPQPSYWEATAGSADFDAAPLNGDESCDVAIIGGGYTGLSAALHLARDADIDARVVEAGHIGWGASGRNGGFCTPGGTGVHLQDFVRMRGLEHVREYYAAQLRAVELVQALGSDEGIDYQRQGDAEIELAHTARARARLQKDRELLSGELGMQAEFLTAAEFRERYFDCSENHGGLVLRPSFGLHPLRFCHGLAAAALRHGARLHAHSEVLDWQRDTDGWHRLACAGGTLRARRVVFATNGFMPEALHPAFAARTIPVLSAIIVTRPLTVAERDAQGWLCEDPAINSRRILNYFRLLPDGRFLLGGRGDARGTVDGERQTYRDLESMLQRLWPAWRKVEIEYRWHGLICMTAWLNPVLGRLQDDETVYFGFGYHGNGVNTATWTGQQLAHWIARGREPDGIPAIMRGLSRRYPLPGLRQSYLRLGLFLSRQLDRFA